MSQSIALSHVRCLVADFEPLLRFYRDVLGLKVAVDVPGVYAELETGGARLAFYRADLMAGVVGGAVATRLEVKQLRCLVEKRGSRVAGLENWMLDDVFKKLNVGFDPTDAKFAESAIHALASLLEIATPSRDLHE